MLVFAAAERLFECVSTHSREFQVVPSQFKKNKLSVNSVH